MEALGATVLVSTPSYALHLIEVARERGLDLRGWPVRVTVHAGEPGAGIPAVRARIEAGFGARAYDHAGMTEVGAHAFECAAQAGLHVNEAEFIAEVIDPATGEPAEAGELVLTNLGRAGSPAVRYRSGDRVCLSRDPCRCGRTFLRLPGGIQSPRRAVSMHVPAAARNTGLIGARPAFWPSAAVACRVTSVFCNISRFYCRQSSPPRKSACRDCRF